MNGQYADPLCCCEYFDIYNQRNHVLACCCDCQDLDESVDSWISGRAVSRIERRGCMAVFLDRLRIPWIGGAQKIPLVTLLPVLMLYPLYILGTVNFASSMATLLSIPTLICASYRNRNLPTKFFLATLLCAYCFLFVSLQFVKETIEITVLENLALCFSTYLLGLCTHSIVKKNEEMKMSIKSDGEEFEGKKSNRFCTGCQAYVTETREFHCVWFDSCVGRHNRTPFVTFIITITVLLLYTSSMVFSSICDAVDYEIGLITVPVPKECSEVYFQFELSLAFVIALNCLATAIPILIFTVYYLAVVILTSGCKSIAPKQCSWVAWTKRQKPIVQY